MSKRKPELWSVETYIEGDTSSTVFAADGSEVVIVRGPRHRKHAALIAAAPRLLANLKRWQAFAKANGWKDADHHDADGTGWLADMDLAIRDAEGGR